MVTTAFKTLYIYSEIFGGWGGDGARVMPFCTTLFLLKLAYFRTMHHFGPLIAVLTDLQNSMFEFRAS